MNAEAAPEAEPAQAEPAPQAETTTETTAEPAATQTSTTQTAAGNPPLLPRRTPGGNDMPGKPIETDGGGGWFTKDADKDTDRA